MSKKKIRASRELMYVIGMILLPFAVNLMIRADFGLSMIAAPAYIISEKLNEFPIGDILTLGRIEWIIQGLVLVLMCIVVKKFKIAYLTSFLTAILYGLMIDLFGWMMESWLVEAMWLRVIFFVVGMLVTASGVAFFLHTYISPCAYDYFVKTVVEEKKVDLRKFKIGNDIVYLVVSLVLSLTLFHGFKGITIGTIVVVAFNGNIISAVSKWIDNAFELYDHFPKISKHF